jgi:hypothetical protein
MGRRGEGMKATEVEKNNDESRPVSRRRVIVRP